MADAVAWQLVRRAAAGNPRARRRLVEATVDDLWKLALRLTRQPDRADDVVQETYARAFAALPGLRPTGRFEGYLARVATNLVLEEWRRARPVAAAAEATLAAGEPEPWRHLAETEDRERRLAAVREAVDALAPEPRAALTLFHAQGLSLREVAEELGAPEGTVKTWLHRARRQVRSAAEARLNHRAAPAAAPTGDAR